MVGEQADDSPECLLRKLYPPDPDDGQSRAVDLVFVHGLGGGLIRTWKHDENREPWIQNPNFLGKLKDDIRVLSFGYNANRFGDVSISTINDHANSLLINLEALRIDCQSRPIIFICHSLGGLVVKSAIILAHLRESWRRFVAQSTKAILFLGTPHFGAERAEALHVVQRVAAFASFKPKDVTILTKELKPHSDTIQRINRTFTSDMYESIFLLCCYETKPQRLPHGPSDIVVPMWSAVLPGQRDLEMDCSHSELPKFASPKEARFLLFWGQVELAVKSIMMKKDLHRVFKGDEKLNGETDATRDLALSGVTRRGQDTTVTTGLANVNDDPSRVTLARSSSHHIHVHVHSGMVMEAIQRDDSELPTSSTRRVGSIKHTNTSTVDDDSESDLPTLTEEDIVLLNRLLNLLGDVSPVNLSVPPPQNAGEGTMRYQSLQPFPSTCRWVPDQPVFGDWLESSAGGMLFITGPAKSGKSYVSRFLADYLRSKMSAHTVLTFYCDNSDNTRTDPPILNYLVKSLLEQHKYCVLAVQEEVRQAIQPNFKPSFPDLVEILKSILQNVQGCDIYIILDGLDQCPEDFSRNLLQRLAIILKELSSKDRRAAGSRLMILVTCQPVPSVRGFLADHFHIQATAELIAPDIRLVVTESVRNFCNAKQLDVDVGTLANLIVDRAKDDFLYATSTVEELWRLQHLSLVSVFSAIMSCPRTMELKYKAQFDNLIESDNHVILFMVCAVFCAQRSLKVTEMAYLLRLRFDHIFPGYDLEGVVARHCKELISISPEQFLELRHSTVRDFLQEKIKIHQIHRIMAALCMSHILTVFSEDEGDNETIVELYTPSDLDPTYPFLHYAAANWGYHLRLAKGSGEDTEEIPKMIQVFFDSGHAYERWDHYCDRKDGWQGSISDWKPEYRLATLFRFDLHDFMPEPYKMVFEPAKNAPNLLERIYRWLPWTHADSQPTQEELFAALEASLVSSLFYAVRGDGQALQRILPLFSDVNCYSISSSGYTALHQTIRYGNKRAVELLLDANVNIDREADGDGETPVLLACLAGHTNIVELLLERGANPDIATKNGVSPLEIAILQDDTACLRLLIKHGVRTNRNMSDSAPPVFYAYQNDSFECLDVLFDLDTFDVNQVWKDLTLIQSAIVNNSLKVVVSLLARGAEINLPAEGYPLATPVYIAVDNGHLDILTELIKYDAAVDAPGPGLESALHLAVLKETDVYASKLLEANCQVNALDSDDMSPLTIACREKRVDMAMLLLKHGAKADQLKDDTPSPLQAAAWAGSLELVQMLLALDPPRRPDVNVAWNGKTALYQATLRGHVEVVGVLLESGAKVNCSNNGRSPLYNAVHGKYLEITKLLLENNAAITPDDPLDFSPFHVAVYEGQIDMVQEILNHADDKRALVNLEWGQQYSPLIQAGLGGNVGIVNLLIELGSDTAYKTPAGYTVLMAASSGGNLAILDRILEECGIDSINQQDNEGGTALMHASSRGHYSVVARLVELGAHVLHKTSTNRGTIYATAEGGNVKIVDLLLSVRPDLDVAEETSSGVTPLHVASDCGHSEMVSHLYALQKSRSPKISITGNNWSSPQPIFSVIGKWQHTTLDVFLAIPELDFTATDWMGRNPLLFALCWENRIAARRLLSMSASKRSNSTQSVAEIEDGMLQQEDSFGFNVSDYLGCFSRRKACRRRIRSVIQRLLLEFVKDNYDRDLGLSRLGQCLIQLGSLGTARTAHTLAVYIDERPLRPYIRYQATCNGCSEPILGTYNACTRCVDVDLCSPCLAAYRSGTLLRRPWTCRDHEYLEVLLPDFDPGDVSSFKVKLEGDRDAFLEEMRQQYGEATQNEDTPDHHDDDVEDREYAGSYLPLVPFKLFPDDLNFGLNGARNQRARLMADMIRECEDRLHTRGREINQAFDGHDIEFFRVLSDEAPAPKSESETVWYSSNRLWSWAWR